MRWLLPLIAGCTLYTGGGDDTCGLLSNAPAENVRDPTTGNCFAVGPSCDPKCGPCPDIAQVEGPLCAGPCENLGEGACLATATCHATYTGSTFDACWDTQPLAAQPGACTVLDALACASRDDCVSQMNPDFVACADKRTIEENCDAVTCDPTTWCVVRCDANGCTPTCIPDGPTTPGICGGVVACVIDPPVCPTNSTAGIANGCFTGYCIPTSDCGSPSPGACSGVMCNIAPPACPSGTTPGVKNGCYDGYCIPVGACP